MNRCELDEDESLLVGRKRGEGEVQHLAAQVPSVGEEVKTLMVTPYSLAFAIQPPQAGAQAKCET